MKKVLFIMTMMILACNATLMAQQARIAYFSYQEVLNNLPEYITAKQSIATAKEQLTSELKSSEQEFSDKYQMFLEQQSTLAPAIKEKRQADLINLYDRNVKFRQTSEASLKQKEEEALSGVKEKVDNAISEIGQKGAYLVILNTDSDACPYIDQANTVDVTQEIIKAAKAAK